MTELDAVNTESMSIHGMQFVRTKGVPLVFHRENEFVDFGLANVGLVAGATWSDVDGDGWSDLMVSVTADINGDARLDLIAASNNGPLLAFENRIEAEFLLFSLAGPPGNVDAIGAKITAIYADGTERMLEVNSTFRYLSQSSHKAGFPNPATNRIQQIIVRWPKGKQTHHSALQLRRFVRIQAPTN